MVSKYGKSKEKDSKLIEILSSESKMEAYLKTFGENFKDIDPIIWNIHFNAPTNKRMAILNQYIGKCFQKHKTMYTFLSNHLIQARFYDLLKIPYTITTKKNGKEFGFKFTKNTNRRYFILHKYYNRKPKSQNPSLGVFNFEEDDFQRTSFGVFRQNQNKKKLASRNSDIYSHWSPSVCSPFNRVNEKCKSVLSETDSRKSSPIITQSGLNLNRDENGVKFLTTKKKPDCENTKPDFHPAEIISVPKELISTSNDETRQKETSKSPLPNNLSLNKSYNTINDYINCISKELSMNKNDINQNINENSISELSSNEEILISNMKNCNIISEKFSPERNSNASYGNKNKNNLLYPKLRNLHVNDITDSLIKLRKNNSKDYECIKDSIKNKKTSRAKDFSSLSDIDVYDFPKDCSKVFDQTKKVTHLKNHSVPFTSFSQNFDIYNISNIKEHALESSHRSPLRIMKKISQSQDPKSLLPYYKPKVIEKQRSPNYMSSEPSLTENESQIFRKSSKVYSKDQKKKTIEVPKHQDKENCFPETRSFLRNKSKKMFSRVSKQISLNSTSSFSKSSTPSQSQNKQKFNDSSDDDYFIKTHEKLRSQITWRDSRNMCKSTNYKENKKENRTLKKSTNMNRRMSSRRILFDKSDESSNGDIPWLKNEPEPNKNQNNKELNVKRFDDKSNKGKKRIKFIAKSNFVNLRKNELSKSIKPSLDSTGCLPKKKELKRKSNKDKNADISFKNEHVIFDSKKKEKFNFRSQNEKTITVSPVTSYTKKMNYSPLSADIVPLPSDLLVDNLLQEVSQWKNTKNTKKQVHKIFNDSSELSSPRRISREEFSKDSFDKNKVCSSFKENKTPNVISARNSVQKIQSSNQLVRITQQSNTLKLQQLVLDELDSDVSASSGRNTKSPSIDQIKKVSSLFVNYNSETETTTPESGLISLDQYDDIMKTVEFRQVPNENMEVQDALIPVNSMLQERRLRSLQFSNSKDFDGNRNEQAKKNEGKENLFNQKDDTTDAHHNLIMEYKMQHWTSLPDSLESALTSPGEKLDQVKENFLQNFKTK